MSFKTEVIKTDKVSKQMKKDAAKNKSSSNKRRFKYHCDPNDQCRIKYGRHEAHECKKLNMRRCELDIKLRQACPLCTEEGRKYELLS